MGQNLEALSKRTELQFDELKAMFLTMSKLLTDENIRQNTSRDKLTELETLVGFLAQSSISPDILNEIKTLLDILAKSSKAGKDKDNINSELRVLRVKLSQVYSKMQGTDELCVNICKSADKIANNEDVNRELQKQLKVIKQIQKDNQMYMNEILQQLNEMSQTADNKLNM